MCRMQEYYESNHKKLFRKAFSWPTFLDVMSDEEGNLNYFSYWKGFNITSHIFLKFYEVFLTDLSEQERLVYNSVKNQIDTEKPFYIIASGPQPQDDFDHEMAHALFYLCPEYQKTSSQLVKALPQELQKKMKAKLLSMGYGKSVLEDEIQAYLATTGPTQLKEMFGLGKKETLTLTKHFKKLLYDSLAKSQKSRH